MVISFRSHTHTFFNGDNLQHSCCCLLFALCNLTYDDRWRENEDDVARKYSYCDYGSIKDL